VENGVSFYSPPFTAERTSDINKNVVLAGAALKDKLQEYNIPVIHSLKIHDAVSYRDSYSRALETIQEYISKYPSIRYIIDLHRDSMIADSGEKYKPTIKIDGADTAQVMIVTGTDSGGASHQNWRDNLAFTAYFQQKMNSKYPMLARPINLRAARFNQHITTGSIILEIGSCGSTFGEALRAAELVGECLAELILEHN
jgi:stage II sporulation protein P